MGLRFFVLVALAVVVGMALARCVNSPTAAIKGNRLAYIAPVWANANNPNATVPVVLLNRQ